MMYEIKRLDLLSVFKVSLLVYLIIGFLLGILYALLLVGMMSALSPLVDDTVLRELGSLGAMGAMMLALFMSVIFAVLWSVLTVIAAGIYNVISGWLGGIKLELEAPPMPYIPPMNPPSPPPEA
ncbi:MAG: DUF3566 domain-containing protein [bacterium]